MMGYYDGKEYTQFDSIENFTQHVLRHRYRSFYIFGHYAGKYDSLFILNHFFTKKSAIDFTTITQGSKVISLKIKKNKNTWVFADSSAIFPNLSLEKLTKNFNVEHKKITGVIDFNTEKISKTNKNHQEYLKNDCIGLYEVLKSYLSNEAVKEEGFNLTAASQAMSMWRRTLNKSVKVSPQKVQNFCRQGYVGGRTEIFKMKGDALNYYDVNSLYPYILRNNRFPTEFKKQTRDITSSLGFYDVSLCVPDMYIPILPVKHNKKLVFPTGSIRGVFYSEELKLALEHGYQIDQIHDGYEFYESEGLFNEYIDYWFEQKRVSEKGSSQELISKLFLNSLYGKFGQKEERLTLKTDEGEINSFPFHSHEVYKLTGLIEVPKFHRSPHMLVHIAAAVTSYARMHMFKISYSKFPKSCYYTDTDSIFTDQTLETSDKLGDLKLVDSSINGQFKLPKAYYLEKNGQFLEAKIKGFSSSFVKKISKEAFIKSDFVEQKEVPCTLKTSIIRNKCYLSKIGITKQLRSFYDKRRVLKNGDTEPWVFKNGNIINIK